MYTGCVLIEAWYFLCFMQTTYFIGETMKDVIRHKKEVI